tara:strand:+ start:16753 stop:17550 length:798 start_codon:yes stop_codon:yes gene_type:complete
MIIQKEFLNKLKDFGLNTYEAKLWSALLSRGISTAGELSDIANVPRSRTYDVLESLERKGFIVMKLGKPIKYIAVPPGEVVERVKKRIKNEANQNVKVLDEIKQSKILDDLNTLHKQGIELVEPSDMSGALKGRENLYSHLNLMVKNAEKSVVMVTSQTGFERKAGLLKKTFEKLNQRGVKIKIAAPIKKGNKAAKEISKFADVRALKNMKARFCIIDGKELMFMLIDDTKVHPAYDTGIWVNTELFATTMSELFEQTWKGLEKV